ncbi:MAG: amino acid racemase [Nitrospiraceae bacterium]|nr:amino acid racemase [Nitrospiraceae bacterium]
MERAGGKVIGIIGGVGPYAGLDITRKIFDQTIAKTDQAHLNVVLCSFPSSIPDRTGYLLGGKGIENPARGLFNVARALERAGAEVLGIPCNTSHSPEIFGRFRRMLSRAGSGLDVLNMIEETALFVSRHYPHIREVGVLCTTGTAQSDIYGRALAVFGIKVLYPDAKAQRENVHKAIYDLQFGIKAFWSPVTETAVKKMREAALHLKRKGVQGIVLGCTEIPLALADTSFLGLPSIDPTLILARALIRSTAPRRLKKFNL